MKPAAALLLLVSFSGCGGGKNGLILPDLPGPSPKELLREEGLLLSLGVEKTLYRRGEPVTFWLSATNTGSKTRTLELRRKWDEPGEYNYTYGCAVFYYHPDGTYPGVWGVNSYEPVTRQVRPGQEIRLLEFVWDQRTVAGTSADLGYYDVGIRMENLYVDGRAFGMVEDGFRTIQIQP